MTGVVIININNAQARDGRRDMNRIGIALIFLMILQVSFSLAVYLVLIRNSGEHLTFYGFTLQDISRTLAQLKSLASKNVLSMPFALLVATVVGNTVPFVICARACGIKVGEIFARPKVSAQTTALFGTVAIGASIFVSIFVGILESLLKYVHLKLTTPAFVIPWSSPAGTVAVILAVVIIAPLTEEFICRGVLLRAFRRYGDVFAVVASSLAWALLHGNFVQGIPVFCMGIIFGMLALKSDSIIPTFIIHSVNNILSLIDSSAAQNSIVSKLFSGSFNIVLLFTAIVLYCVFFNQFRIKRNGSPARGFAAFFTSVPVIIFILVCAALTIMSIKPL